MITTTTTTIGNGNDDVDDVDDDDHESDISAAGVGNRRCLAINTNDVPPWVNRRLLLQ